MIVRDARKGGRRTTRKGGVTHSSTRATLNPHASPGFPGRFAGHSLLLLLARFFQGPITFSSHGRSRSFDLFLPVPSLFFLPRARPFFQVVSSGALFLFPQTRASVCLVHFFGCPLADMGTANRQQLGAPCFDSLSAPPSDGAP